ncbi:uncharacterized protein B0H18DRAFT_1005066 [Fomitopsis serialis]|uniref:uncharacterized protein n=1 Tax=Fomitopsis serialis TaxID=139415 RepID=UPI0020086CD9|nr:uncharacterized protein B0H18DRAFT_1005066 [Neoantrodia serialis]KAH9926677.1 hypothetical protein B0H18DRAFT_1005066 [Neoantrodia serialis]
MSSQRDYHQHPDANRAGMAHPPTAGRWSTPPSTLNSVPTCTRGANDYTRHLPPALALSTGGEAASYSRPFTQGSEATQNSYGFPAAYGNTYDSRYPRAEAAHTLYSTAASHIPGAIARAPPSYWSDAGATNINHNTAYTPTTYADQYRDMSLPFQSPHYATSPGSPASSSSSSYHSISPYQLTGMPSVPESIPFPPADPVPRIPCRWIGCNVLLDDISTAGIKRHLRDWHGDLSGTSHKDRRTCMWDDGPANVCGRELDAASFAKHIASVHLKSTAQECEYCHNVIGRADSLARHKRDHCPQRPNK